MKNVLEQAELIAEKAFAGAAQAGKIPGDNIFCDFKFKHKGGGGTCYVSWGIAIGSDVPGVYNDTKIVWIVKQNVVNVGEDADFMLYNFQFTGKFPNILPGTGMMEGNFFDCYLVIEMPINTIKDYQWFDDIYYRRDLAASEFKDLTAAFT